MNSFGYTRASKFLRAALLGAGAEPSREADVVVHFQAPVTFNPWPGRHNALFTMWEHEGLPARFIEAFSRADSVIAPSAWCADLFRRHTDRPVHVCPLGVDVDHFVGIDRPLPGTREHPEPATFLWLGAHNLRKGWAETLEAWGLADFHGRRDVRLVMKTTDAVQQRYQQDNVVVDTRVLPDSQLLALYAEADCAVFPSWGDGFGFFGLEAMATALPVVMPLHTGLTEYADASCVIPVGFEPFAAEQVGIGGEDDVAIEMLRPKTTEIADRLGWVHRHWRQARKIGRRAHARAQAFSWEAVGRRLLAVLEDIARGRAAAA